MFPHRQINQYNSHSKDLFVCLVTHETVQSSFRESSNSPDAFVVEGIIKRRFFQIHFKYLHLKTFTKFLPCIKVITCLKGNKLTNIIKLKFPSLRMHK